MSAPVDNLVRAWASPEATQLRAKEGDEAGDTMVGHFAVFNRWTEIDSFFEGNFLERIASTAFDATFEARGDQVRVLYDHGADPMIGNKPLGTPRVMRSDKTGAYYEVDLFDSSYVNDLKPAIRAGQLGASFRFRVTAESWNDPVEPSDWNPQMLPERTIDGTELYEFGPVTFPVYPDASAGMRSRTDEFLEHFLNDPQFVARFKERVGPAVTERVAEAAKAITPADPAATVAALETWVRRNGPGAIRNAINSGLPPTAEMADAEPDVLTPAADAEPPAADRDTTPEVTDDVGPTDDTYQRRLAQHARRVAPFVAHLERKDTIR